LRSHFIFTSHRLRLGGKYFDAAPALAPSSSSYPPFHKAKFFKTNNSKEKSWGYFSLDFA
jgi:hypothetical protein